jgi:putative phosphoribosyl transferase
MGSQCTYRGRMQAGNRLASYLSEYAESPDVVVVALARGGVPVAFELARVLRLPLEILVADRRHESTARMYRSGRQPVSLEGKQVILVDDGLSGESLMRHAVLILRSKKPRRTIVALPAASAEARRLLESEADIVVCPVMLRGAGESAACYEDSSSVTDHEVQALMRARV